MKIEDMVMVIYNHKGIEKNFLCSFETFIKQHATDVCDSYFEMAEVAAGLQETKQKSNSFFEMYYSANETMYVRFCKNENDLRLFVAGKLNDDVVNTFEPDMCDRESLDVLDRLGVSTDRSVAVIKWPHYEKLESDLQQGEIYHNFNGSDYRLMEKYSGRNMLFMDVNSGQFVVGVGVDYFTRYPQDEDRHSSLCEIGIEWGSGVYLGNICRSPMAEFVLKDMTQKQNISHLFHIASCATSTEEIWNGVGNPVYPPAKKELAKHGISCEGKRAVQLRKDDYDKYDYLICMDSANVRNSLRILGGDPENKIKMCLEFAGIHRDVADPWYTGRFETTYNDVVMGCEGLLEHLRGQGKL